MLRSAVFAITACSILPAAATASPPPSMFAKAKSLIRTHMIDPASLQYRNLRVVHQNVQGKSVTVACGDFNAKNKLGGYGGFQTFAYEPTILKGVLTIDDDAQVSFFGADGADEMSHREVFENADVTGPIYAACLGLKE